MIVYISAHASYKQVKIGLAVNNRRYLIGWAIRGRLVSCLLGEEN